MNWCDECGQVGKVCDFPECDAHRRDLEVEEEWREAERELAADSRRMLDAFHARHKRAASPSERSMREEREKREERAGFIVTLGSFHASSSEAMRAKEAHDEYVRAKELGSYAMVPRGS